MPDGSCQTSPPTTCHRLISVAAEGMASLGVREPSLDLLRPIAETIAALEPATDDAPQPEDSEDAR